MPGAGIGDRTIGILDSQPTNQGPVTGIETTPTNNTEQVATSIAWSDEQAGSGKATDEGIPTEQAIADTKGGEVATQVAEATGDAEFAEQAAQVVGAASGVESYLANLNTQIDKQQDKRKKARLLAFGLALLGGESMSSALQVANQTPFFDEEDLDQLLAQRKDLMNGLHNEYLESQGITTAGTDAAASGTDKPIKLTATLEKEIRDLTKKSEENKLVAGRINGLIGDIETHGGWAGVGGTAAEFFKGLAGSQENVSQWKSDFTRLVNSEIVNNLPPGVASDKDIELIKSGFPNNTWNQEQLVGWLQAYRNTCLLYTSPSPRDS